MARMVEGLTESAAHIQALLTTNLVALTKDWTHLREPDYKINEFIIIVLICKRNNVTLLYKVALAISLNFLK
jgi:hypothetical protein